MGDTSSCTEHFTDFFHHVEYSETPSIEIGSGTKKGDHLVQFGCSYAVSVQASPIISPDRPLFVNITVPDCVEGVCRCGSRPRLPKPEELATHEITVASGLHDERSYLVSWSYRGPLEEATDTTVVVRVERAENVLGLGPVFRKVREYRHNVVPGLNFFQQPIHHLEFHSNYRIRILAYDSHHCEGQIAEVYLNRDVKLEKDPSLHKETMVSAVVFGVIFLAVMALVIALSWRRFLRRLHLMAATAATGNHTPARYSRSPQNFHRDSRRTTLLTNGSSGTCQRLMNVLHADRDSEEPRHHLLGNNKVVDDYEIDPSQVKLGVEIGKGAFGRVHLATVENLPGLPGPTLVAVKQMKKKVGLDERDDFLAEIAMMKRVGRHENIVVMLACVTLNQPYSMILEYVPYGDLLHYLRTLRAVYHQSKVWSVDSKVQHHPDTVSASIGGSSSSVALLPRKSTTHSTSDSSKSYHLNHIFASMSSQSTGSSHSSSSYVIPNYYRGLLKAFPTSRTIDTEELHDFARQIARGMEHLELKGITHRDLAARNLLVSEGRVLKISDFGLSRHGVYVNTRKRMLPLRWLALESMTDNLYSSLSDVWAFGVVLWEICTLGGFPYANISDAQLMTYLLSGNRLIRPDNVSEKLYQVMLKCWSANPDDRPTFRELRCSLEDFEAHHENYVDFSCSSSSQAHALPPTEEEITII
ncbi:platelet-derived growth factor receptor alpha-like [Daphnia carinata]|uniref:platelet-derived growth factor receptor alpha-like n=1 Tax=Daphnia carinata TaxID=120202 RepID=UPI00257DC622|nr:platelet-derived growth factor receptor alpha-like [Daphnia carinata]XP_059350294.1 platelet-derived growth factor receptor alpha-like [Daphnia carinata]XP_059350295.1 platelet-derived growth factor receptor alpha-like [Daphnia carinata]